MARPESNKDSQDKSFQFIYPLQPFKFGYCFPIDDVDNLWKIGCKKLTTAPLSSAEISLLERFVGQSWKIDIPSMCRNKFSDRFTTEAVPASYRELHESGRLAQAYSEDDLKIKFLPLLKIKLRRCCNIQNPDLLTWEEIFTAIGEYMSDKSKKYKKSPKPNCQHSEDYTSVVWFRKSYQFTKTQALCVKYLWEEWGKSEGLGLSEKTIGEKISSDSDNYKLKHTFRVRHGQKYRQHPAWGKMIASCGKGKFCLKSSRKK